MITSSTALAAAIPMDVPVGWSDPDKVNVLQALLVFAGIPIGLFILITIAVYIPALVRGERITPGAPPVEDQWLGGPRSGTAQLSGPDGPAADAEAGGASGRW